MAVLQHITHTAIFTWMLVEGIHLYIKLVKVFSVHKFYITYIVIGWGKALFTAFIISLIQYMYYDCLTQRTLAVHQSLQRPLNSKYFLNLNLPPLFKPRVLLTILLTSSSRSVP